ncbi:MAG TPA: DMT family transporter [Kofleriaceae bacterium]|nr:DMT family transporter [Kofleriaceae bacterium]
MKPPRAVVYMAASAFGFSVMSMLVKVATARLPTGEIVLARGVVTFVASYAMVRHARLSPWGTNRRGLALRGLLGFGGLSFYYLSLAHLPLADATTIQNATPLVTSLLAWWLLREEVGWSTAFAIVCGIAGVGLVVQPSSGRLETFGVAVAFGGTACSAVAYVTVRQLARTEHPLVIVWYFPLVATPLVVPWAVATWQTPTAREWLLLVAIGLATQAGQVFLTLALAIERAGRVTSVGYLQIAFAMGWQWLVFAQPPTLWTIAGASLIVLGTTAITLTAPRRSP